MQEKPTLIYVGDPMCSWCYGVSEEMSKVKEHFSESHDFKLMMGGLRPYNTETMVDLKEFLTHHWEEVQQQSGQPFTYGILDNSNITYDTEPPCRAVVVVREMNPPKAFEFFKAVQKSFYYENKNMHLTESYRSALEHVNISYDEFAKEFESPEAKEQVQSDFAASAELGVRSFPTLLLKQGDELTVVANGYLSAEKMIQRIVNEMKSR
jgi:putative protein-disulfide isomerase